MRVILHSTSTATESEAYKNEQTDGQPAERDGGRAVFVCKQIKGERERKRTHYIKESPNADYGAIERMKWFLFWSETL